MSAKQTAKNFWGRVAVLKDKRSCWEWLGACNSTGYGTVAVHGRVYTAHRVAAWYTGMVASLSAPTHKGVKGFVLHKCDNRKCCNPSHFVVGSYADNQLDAYRKKRRAQPKGEAHANAKLSNTQAREIRSRYKKGEYQTALAKEYRVSQYTISLIVRGVTYR